MLAKISYLEVIFKISQMYSSSLSSDSWDVFLHLIRSFVELFKDLAIFVGVKLVSIRR